MEKTTQTPSRRELERLHKIVVQDLIFYCPTCKCEQHSNGLITWCERGHIYKLAVDDLRYNER